MEILVIGGGASGMMAALTAAEAGHRVTLLERQARMGRKLLATGNGRCNLTNRHAAPAHYHGENREFCAYALSQFGVEETLKFFESHGLLTVTEDSGRVYPFSDSANSVADVLRLHLEQNPNVTIVTGCEVASLSRKKRRFMAQTGENSYTADGVILCAGGIAGGKLGGTDLGYRLLASFGHTRTKLCPALVQIKTDPTYVRSLKGVRTQAEVAYGKEKRRGEVQFTDYGLSGPLIFELSRKISTEGARGELTLDFLPNLEFDRVEELLHNRCAALPKLKTEDLLTGMLHNRLGRTMVRASDLSLEQPCGALSENQLRRLTHTLKHFALPIQAVMGMEGAQVTAGGIRTSEFCDKTMESRLCPGLYAAGEVLDIDGDCGGYNLQWAWASGHLAGELRGTK